MFIYKTKKYPHNTIPLPPAPPDSNTESPPHQARIPSDAL